MGRGTRQDIQRYGRQAGGLSVLDGDGVYGELDGVALRVEEANLAAGAGFTTQDHQRCQIMARIVALIYNWWSLFTRLAIPNRHTEATTSRPLLLHGIGRQTTHANQTTLTITSNHARQSRFAGP